jgi:O-methyltransferase domain
MAQTPFDVLSKAGQAFIVSSCVYAVAQAGIADALSDSPKSAQDLADATRTHAGALRRILRVLCGEGVFEVHDERYVHTPASRRLRKDHPQSLRGYVLSVMPLFWEPFSRMSYSLATGKPAFEEIHPGGFFKYLADHPEEARIFDAAMTGKAHGQVAGAIANYDFSRFGMIADVGGGRGHLLQAVLQTAPKAKGILFDLPHVVEAAKEIASDRLKLLGGDFFNDSMPVADAYLIMQVIHDWADADATRILSGIRRAAPAHAKLLLIELLVPETPERDWAKEVDLFMLVFLHSRERTRSEYQQLLAGSGFRLDRVIDIGQSTAILEAAPI